MFFRYIYKKNVSQKKCIKDTKNNLIFGNNTKPKKIKLICNWTDSKSLYNDWKHMFIGNTQKSNIKITYDDNPDYYFIIN